MTQIYPDDADGVTLRRIAQRSDMTLPMEIDFHILLRSEAAARDCLQTVTAAGYHARVYGDPNKPDYWTVECTLCMVADYNEIIRIQNGLDGLAAPHGGKSDGWGTLGNSPEQPGGTATV